MLINRFSNYISCNGGNLSGKDLISWYQSFIFYFVFTHNTVIITLTCSDNLSNAFFTEHVVIVIHYTVSC